MRAISKKREKQIELYRIAKKELFLKDLVTGKLFCFFSGKKIILPEELKCEDDDTLIKYLECHHLSGERENEHLFDKVYMVPVFRPYHTKYHSLDVKRLLMEPWYHGFLSRLKSRDFELYAKELYKQVKSNLITIEEYDSKLK